MSSFKGTYQYSVDAKGRLSLPMKLKKNVSLEAKDQFVITRGKKQCLFLYPDDEWTKIEAEYRKLNSYVDDDDNFLHLLYECAEDVSLDSQSRIMIPPSLREFANIESEVKVIGLLSKIEIWNPQLYDQYKKSIPESYEHIATKVMTQKG
jgi:MraZ protein